ncbi:transcriptional regulator with XRE-family HTH domain [Microbacterium testaceum]|uniref:helix-turn-helix domain-containing protein n=1 Tax=Microbacterium TaxID=33882 RepID=UPI002783FA66|nr:MULTISPECIES: helix-turn-helix transcriptional regulator [Microbacterium]MDQ1110558.1 transcriptional regulator with XRE-family HTH domain [Microbacterium testaceum]MDR6098897.1 transcriptional regulator with XRE-family HTH domain [Microbacterium sp. SORGH_AS_0454]
MSNEEAEKYGEAFSQAVASELRAERARKQKTVASIAETTGLSKSAVLHYLNGKRGIPTSAFALICRAMAVSPLVIFERAEKALENPGG